MVDLKNSYFHSLVFGEEKTLEVFENIIKNGKILSLQRSGIELDNKRLNKPDEICLSKKEKINFKYDSAYDMYVRNNLTFVISGNLPNVYKPEIISPLSLIFRDLESFSDSGLTNMSDEYRIKDEIPIDEIVGITIPINSIITNNNIGYYLFFCRDRDYDEIKRQYISSSEKLDRTRLFYESIVKIMNDNNVDIPIYDLNGNKISTSDDIKIKMKKMR